METSELLKVNIGTTLHYAGIRQDIGIGLSLFKNEGKEFISGFCRAKETTYSVNRKSIE